MEYNDNNYSNNEYDEYGKYSELNDVAAIQERSGDESHLIKKDLTAAGLFFFLLMIMELPVALVINEVQGMFPVEKEILISVLITQGYLLLAALIYLLIRRKSFTGDLHVRSYKLASFFLSLLVLLCASPMANCLNVISQFFTVNRTSEAIFDITESVPAWLALLIVGCLPGFIEETIYRGIMYSAFRRYSILVGIIISSLSFGLMHLNFNQMIYAIYLGSIFAFLVEATGSLASSMILHMLFNVCNTIYLYLLPLLFSKLSELGIEDSSLNIEDLVSRTPTNAELMSALMFFAPLAVVGLILTVLLISKIADINGRKVTWKSLCEKKDGLQKVKPVNIWLILGWIFCIIISIGNL